MSTDQTPHTDYSHSASVDTSNSRALHRSVLPAANTIDPLPSLSEQHSADVIREFRIRATNRFGSMLDHLERDQSNHSEEEAGRSRYKLMASYIQIRGALEGRLIDFPHLAKTQAIGAENWKQHVVDCGVTPTVVPPEFSLTHWLDVVARVPSAAEKPQANLINLYLMGEELSHRQVHAHLGFSILDNHHWREVSALGSSFFGAKISDSSFSSCHFNGTNFGSAALKNCTFTGCIFDKDTDLRISSCDNVTFIRCDLSHVEPHHIKHLQESGAVFDHCQLPAPVVRTRPTLSVLPGGLDGVVRNNERGTHLH